MVPLIRAELRRVVGRRGSFYGSIAFALLITAIAIAADDATSGSVSIDHITSAGRISGLLGIVVMGALAGSYDTAQGTMRYLVLTGVPRWKLAVVRLVGLLLATLPMAIMIIVLGLIASSGVGDGPSGNAVPDAIWAVLSTLWIWALVSASIGMLMRSNGPAIAASVVLFIGGSLITGAVSSYISESLASYLLPSAFAQVSDLQGQHGDGDFKIALGVAFVVLAVWLVALVALAIARVNRDEY